jgi:hypothetical protein
MMEAVANDPREDQPAPPPDIIMPGGGVPAPPPAQRPDISPEEVRQFQEFQRFQELMRKAADEGMPPGNPPPGLLQPWGQPPPKQSLPKRVLKAAVSKIITGLVVLAVLAAGAYFAIDHFLGEDHDQPPAHETGGGKATTNLILPTDPYEAVRMIYHQIANGDGVPEQVCSLRFDDNGKQFATDMGYATCEEAVRGLHAQVTSRDAYAESMPSYKTTFNPKNHDTIRISSCTDSRDGRIEGGPALGVFTVKKLAGSKSGQWQITDHANEPSCVTTSTGPSN